MTREEAKKVLPVIQAYSQGSNVQYQRKDGVWQDEQDPDFKPEWPVRIKSAPLAPKPKEVKPCREWWLCGGHAFTARANAEEWLAFKCGDNAEIVHVREVIG